MGEGECPRALRADTGETARVVCGVTWERGTARVLWEACDNSLGEEQVDHSTRGLPSCPEVPCGVCGEAGGTCMDAGSCTALALGEPSRWRLAMNASAVTGMQPDMVLMPLNMRFDGVPG
mmetsp:Transcript_38713/g.115681  ORF Transcript_38713/g.115681 Transcript_38713/m.115681 type:complete len:120 (+) Transcript_38713:413-772(+)